MVLIAGCVSVLATLFSASYSFLGFAELADRHKQAAASFGDLKRGFEISGLGAGGDFVDDKKLSKINHIWSELEKKVPAIPQKKIYQNTVAGLEQESVISVPPFS